ncbi:hypothetical protein, partial [Actinomadura geliboluensis]
MTFRRTDPLYAVDLT